MYLCVCVVFFYIYNSINLKECIQFRNNYYVLDFIALPVSQEISRIRLTSCEIYIRSKILSQSAMFNIFPLQSQYLIL